MSETRTTILTIEELWKNSGYDQTPLEKNIIKKSIVQEVETIEYFITGSIYPVKIQSYSNYNTKKNQIESNNTNNINHKEYTSLSSQNHLRQDNATLNQKSRVYCKLSRRISDINPPVILLCDEPMVDIANKNVMQYLNLGYAVMQYDYAGENPFHQRYTIYPPMLAHCNFYLHPENAYNVPQDIKKSVWYEWSIISLRVIKLIMDTDTVSHNGIVIIGSGFGSVNAIKVSVLFSNIVGLILNYNFDLSLQEDSNAATMKLLLGNDAYIKKINFPTLIQVASNESDGSFDKNMKSFEHIKSLNEHSRVSISVSKNHDLLKEQSNNEQLWLLNLLYLESFQNFYEMPELISRIENNTVYIQLSINANTVKSVSIYLSSNVGEDNIAPAYRYWRSLKVENIIDDEYISKFIMYYGKEYVFFASIEYINGFHFSTKLHRIGTTKKNSGVKETSKKSIIYDGSMGIDNFTAINIEAIQKGELVIQKGPLDIVGISGQGGELAIFKIGGIHYKGKLDDILQVTMYSSVEQDIWFSVVSSKNYIDYVCKKHISKQKNWTKILLLQEDFKGIGTLDFSTVIFFRVNTQSPIIISNIMWL